MNNDECRQRIAGDLIKLGVQPGGVLLVHSSFKSMGFVPGGIQTVIDGLHDALGAQGTLLMPGLSWVAVDRECPCFDVRATPCCVGAIPEYFRQMEGTLRSMHPTHSVCGQGRQAAALMENHILDTTPCGAHSPFHRLRHHGGQVLMLGCGLLPNTSIHAVEEAAGAPYLFEGQPLEYRLTGYDGKDTRVTHLRHAAFPQHFDRVRPYLLGNGLREGPVLQAGCHLFEAGALWECAFAMLRQDIGCFTRD